MFFYKDNYKGLLAFIMPFIRSLQTTKLETPSRLLQDWQLQKRGRGAIAWLCWYYIN